MKIVYYTHIKGIKGRLQQTAPKGFDIEVIQLDKPINWIFTKNSVLFRTYAKLNWKGADIVHYVADRDNWIENGGKKSLRGLHHRFLGKSYCRSFVRKDWYVKFKKGDDTANDTKRKTKHPQLEYTVYHENLHALSDIKKKEDVLHEWVALGKFYDYEDEYLNPKPPKGLLPKIKRDSERFIKLANQAGFNLRITSGYRSFEEQDELYAQGRTKPGKIVTNAKGGESQHNYGIAFDIVDRFKGYDLSNKEWAILVILWHKIGGKETGWGGLWKSFIDKPHFYNDMGYSLKDFQKGNVDYAKFK